MAAERMRWVLIAYRLPRVPSTPRAALWRKLRAAGAVQVGDGLAALPFDRRNKEQLEWLAEAVVEAGGEATTWVGELTTVRQERELKARMVDAVAAEYEEVAAQARAAAADGGGQARRTLARLRRDLRRIRARDHFPSPQRDRAARAVDELAASLEEALR